MRTLFASILVVAALAAALLGWLGAGWSGLEQREAELRAEPRRRADDRARELAVALAGRLEALRIAEGRRPYVEYRNLYRDPNLQAQGLAVGPSPLARGPSDPLVRSHFEIQKEGAAWEVSMPTVNDEFPELNLGNQKLGADNALRRELVGIAGKLAEAAAAPRPVAVAETVRLPKDVYEQNNFSNEVYAQTQQADVATPPRPRPTAAPVEIPVGTFEWRGATIGDGPALIALRRVETPDGALTQGFVLDDAAIGAWIDERAPGARLVTAETAGGDAPAPATTASAVVPVAGRAMRVVVPIEGLAAAESQIATIRAAFWGRFLPISGLVLLCGALVVVVVARAERFGRARSRFAAAAAHELRTPLAGLQLYGDMLADGLGDPGKSKQYAHRISEEASRLGRVVANVLGFSQLERGDLAVHPAAGDAATAARAVIDRHRPALERAGVAIEVDLPEALPARFDGDAVARILGNLVDNAEKYSRGAADRRITITGTTAGDTVELAVADSGPGVAAGARLFVPFARGVGSDGPAGLGLGLALSRSLARAMGGDLAHAPGAGAGEQGATFVLTLPA